jgi:hypothetical protein
MISSSYFSTLKIYSLETRPEKVGTVPLFFIGGIIAVVGASTSITGFTGVQQAVAAGNYSGLSHMATVSVIPIKQFSSTAVRIRANATKPVPQII